MPEPSLRDHEQPALQFDEATQQASPALRRFAAVLVPVDDRDDLTQDTLTRAWLMKDAFDASRGSFQSWLMAIMADQARRRRRKRRSVSVHRGLMLDRSEPAHEYSDVRAAVRKLPRRQREVVILHYYVDLRIDDIAAILNRSPGTVKSNLSDARKRLSTALGNYHYEH